MNKHAIVFELTADKKIIIDLQEPIERVDCCFRAPIFFVYQNERYILSRDSLRLNLHRFVELLSFALANKLPLHPSIKIHGLLHEDIGWLYNEELQNIFTDTTKDRPYLFYENEHESTVWVGEKHSLWCFQLQSWIYNSSDQKIVLELTSNYPGFWGANEEQRKAKITYEEWIQTYEPFLITEISIEVARTWLTEAAFLLKKIEENIRIDFEKRKKANLIIF